MRPVTKCTITTVSRFEDVDKDSDNGYRIVQKEKKENLNQGLKCMGYSPILEYEHSGLLIMTQLDAD